MDRVCCMCKNQKEDSLFSKDCTKEDGISVRCKECDSLMYHIRKQKREGRIDYVVSKECRICKTEKSASEYGYYAVSVDKLRSECKACRRKPVVVDGITLTEGETQLGPAKEGENGIYVMER